MAKIYVASSWRNEYQPETVRILREHGHSVYDFRNPPHSTGFEWMNVSANYKFWSRADYVDALQTPLAHLGFKSDFDAMNWADTFIQVMPSGVSASLEMGWAAGMGKHTYVYLASQNFEPELMFKLCDHISYSLQVILHNLEHHQPE